MKRRLLAILLPVLFILTLIAGVVLGIYLSSGRGAVGVHPSLNGSRDKLSYTLSLINKLYVDPVNIDSLKEQLVPYLIAELDPHSAYIPVSDVPRATEAINGQFDGIGVMFNMLSDTITITNVIPHGPSETAGLLDGDRIIKINDTIVAGVNFPQEDVVKRLKGRRGTKVNLQIQRPGIKQPVMITVERGIVPMKSLEAAFIIERSVAFVKLSAFAKNSYMDMMIALEQLKQQGMTSLILDLRGNLGGAMDQAIMIANEFLPDDCMIVYTLGRQGLRADQRSRGGHYTTIPLAVLIDEHSASASEILAGAVQDNDRGEIIGRRSFGKGLVQQQIEYPDGSFLRLTIARYYTPTGRSIQKPYETGHQQEYNLDMEARVRNNELFSADSMKFADSLRYTTPGGRTVYGGGGIMPDLFVPLDTTDMNRYYLEVSGRNIIIRYAMQYTDTHREQLRKVASVEDLRRLLYADKGMFDRFTSYASAQGVPYNPAQAERSRKIITAQIWALVGRNTPLEDSGFYAMIYPIDPTVVKAVEELEKIEKK